MDQSTRKKVAASLLATARVLEAKLNFGISNLFVNDVGGDTWPEPAGWDLDNYAFPHDKYGGYAGITYQYVGGNNPALFVDFEIGKASGNDPLPRGSGDFSWNQRAKGPRQVKPNTYEIRGFGETKKGTWDSVRDIPGILQQAVRWNDQMMARLLQKVKRLNVAGWDIQIDGTEAHATYEQLPEFDDSHLTVTFRDLDEVFAGEEGIAEVFYAHGADYGGFFGKKGYEESFSSFQDMVKILKKAERLLQK